MSAKELSRWALYLRHEPTNSTEIQLAYLTHVVSSYLGAKGKTVEDYVITSFRPSEKKEEIIVTSEMLLNAWGLNE